MSHDEILEQMRRYFRQDGYDIVGDTAYCPGMDERVCEHEIDLKDLATFIIKRPQS